MPERAAVDDLSATLFRRMVDGNDACASALRELVVAVVVHPRPSGETGIEVTGWHN
jgi:hypothetical protein